MHIDNIDKSFEFAKGKRLELVSLALVELVLKFHPVQTQGVQEALQTVHADEDPECSCEEEWKDEKELNNAINTPSSLLYPP